jgi:hypothetical protein
VLNVPGIAKVALEKFLDDLEETAALEAECSEERLQCHGIELAVICNL